MTHPTREEWMSYLYDELPADQRSLLHSHFQSCRQCRAEVETWQRASGQMSEWKLPRTRRASAPPALARWAIAAAIVGLAVAGSLRVAAWQSEVKHLRAEMRGTFRNELESAVRQQVAAQMQRDLNAALAEVTEQSSQAATTEAQALINAVAQKLEERRLADQQATFTALQKVNAQRVADYASLRKELETVAVLTEAGFQRAQSEIVNLASSNLSNNNQ